MISENMDLFQFLSNCLLTSVDIDDDSHCIRHFLEKGYLKIRT